MVRRVLATVSLSILLAGGAYLPLQGISGASEAVAAPQVSSLTVQAANLALKGQYSDAGALAERSGDLAAVKLVEFLYLRDHWKDAGYARVMAFLDAAPKWPLAETFMKRAEQALFVNREAPARVLAHFEKRKPVSPEGRLALARALFATGETEQGLKQLRQAWADPTVDATLEKMVLDEFGGQLGAGDHQLRVWKLIFDQSPNAALRNAKRLGSGYVQAAKVAQALLAGAGNAEGQYNALPAAMRQQPAMKYVMARYDRKRERYAKARSILLTVPGNPAAMIDADAFWEERRIIARRSIGPGKKASEREAYKIAANHGFKDGSNAVEGEFLAGWIALRSLGDADAAVRHFKKLADIAPNRTEKARAHYWIGRAFAARGDKATAKEAFTYASQFSTIYYGQLAREQIGLGKVPEEIGSGSFSAAAKARVSGDEVVRALTILAKTGNKQHLNLFIWPMANRFDSLDEMNAAADLAHDIGGTTMALRLAKAAASRSLDIDAWGYPIRGLPNWSQLGKPVEKPLVFGLARQESEFDAKAGSKVGAQGLMQLMPGTAKLVARQHGVGYAAHKLTGDPVYNVRLGAAHLADLVHDYNGSYVLTLVAYNAGPRRVREWVAAYGDPRGGQVDPIDWVESIPFQETRQYVQKVLQNTHIYRSRLAPNTVRPMTADLMRGAPADVTASVSEAEPATVHCATESIGALIKGCN